MKRHALAVVIVLLAFGTAAESQQPQNAVREIRRHFGLITTHNSRFTATTIDRNSEDATSTKVLLQDPEGNQFLFSWEWDYQHQVTFREIREVGATEFVRYSLFLPLTERGKTATLKQAHAHPELMTDKNARFEFSAPGNSSITGTEDFWNDPETAQRWRSRGRQMLSPSFLESLEILQTAGLFNDAELVDFETVIVSKILYRTECSANAAVRNEALLADCAFDKRFGFECSEKQKERAEKYAKQTPPTPKPY